MDWSLREPTEVRKVLARFAEANRAVGFGSDSEAASVLGAASRFVGWRYRITRELADGWIDCSTLVSQSYWEGAALGVPFVAETQRHAYNGTRIDVEEIGPADLLFRYADMRESSDRHNHVVLCLGHHPEMGRWVIESASTGDGVRVRPLHDDDLVGGARRFLRRPEPRQADAAGALRLARSVPKLGRLGARLTSGLDPARRHRGVDLFAGGPFVVLAPLSGTALWSPNMPRSEPASLTIIGADGRSLVRMDGVEPTSGTPATVQAGQVAGRCRSTGLPGCNGIPAYRGLPRLHLEFWSSGDLPWPATGGLSSEPLRTVTDHWDAMRPFNPIYAIKLGLLRSPVCPPSLNAPRSGYGASGRPLPSAGGAGRRLSA